MSNAKRVDSAQSTIQKSVKKAGSSKPKTARAKTSRLGFRASESQAKIIRMASDINQKSLTDFIMDSAYQAAEKVILDQRLFMVSEEVYKQFSEVLDRPEQDNEGLKELFSSSSPWDLNDLKKS